MVKAASKTAKPRSRPTARAAKGGAGAQAASAGATAAPTGRRSAARTASRGATKASKPAASRAAVKPATGKPSPSKPSPSKTSPSKTSVAKAGPGPAAPTTTELGYLSGFLSFHLRLAQDASYRAFARVTDKDLVKPGRFPALAIIHLNPGISQSALGRAIARDKSTVSPLIKDLQQNGLISRKPSPSDRRSVTLALTKKGERMLDRLHARAKEHEAELDQIVGTAKGRLVATLEKITGGLGAGA